MPLFGSESTSINETETNLTDQRVAGAAGLTAGAGAVVNVQSGRALDLANDAVQSILAAEQARNTGELEALGKTLLGQTVPLIALAAVAYYLLKG